MDNNLTTALIIAQLVSSIGIPATREILTLLRTTSEPTLDEWLAVLDRAQTHADAFLARTAHLEEPLDPSNAAGTDVPANP